MKRQGNRGRDERVRHSGSRARPASPWLAAFSLSLILLVLATFAMQSAAAAAGGSSGPDAQAATAANAARGDDQRPLRIGSKRFTESYILAEILAQAVTQEGLPAPQVLQGLGNTAIVFQALRGGNVDLYPDYAGTIALEILKKDATLSLQQMRDELAPWGVGVDIPFGFNNGYALAMRAAHADQLGIRTIGDLARHPQLRLGLSSEFIGRADGWRGLAARYGLPQSPTGLDHGLAYEALRLKRIDVTDIYTTDAKIDALGLRVLEDDRGYFPRYDALVLYRLDVPRRYPAAWAAVRALGGTIDETAMVRMNARAELQGVPFHTIAADWVRGLHGKPAGDASAEAAASPSFEPQSAAAAAAGPDVGNGTVAANGTIGRASAPVKAGAAAAGAAEPGMRSAAPSAMGMGFWDKLFGPDLGRLAWQHLTLVLISVSVAVLLAVPAGVWVYPRPRLRALVLGATGILQTVPSLALLAILIILTGHIGTVPALLALSLYSLLPIMRNTCAGLAQVRSGLRMAAIALGMTRWQMLTLIELPLARPTIVAGIRTAASIAIGTATIAAFIGAGGFGERIVTGLALNDSGLLLAGAIPAAALALLSEVVFELAEARLRRRSDQPAH